MDLTLTILIVHKTKKMNKLYYTGDDAQWPFCKKLSSEIGILNKDYTIIVIISSISISQLVLVSSSFLNTASTNAFLSLNIKSLPVTLGV